MADFRSVLLTLESYGLSDVLLPFILVFTVVFAILQKVKPLGDPDDPRKAKHYNVILALVLGLAVVIPHVMGVYPANADVVDIINKALPNVSIVLVAIVMVLLIVGLFGGKAQWGSTASGFVAIIAFFLVFYIFGRAAGWFEYLPNWLGWLDDPDTQALLLVLGVFALIIWFVTKEPTDDATKGEGGRKFVQGWRDLFGGGGN